MIDLNFVNVSHCIKYRRYTLTENENIEAAAQIFSYSGDVLRPCQTCTLEIFVKIVKG